MPDTTQGLAIVGPGLIGTSIALAAKRRWPDLQVRTIDKGDPLSAIGDALVIVLAAPVDVILAAIPQLPLVILPDALVIDTGSTKREIMKPRPRAPGFRNSSAAIRWPAAPRSPMPAPICSMAGTWFLTNPDAPDAVRRAARFVEALGAKPVVLPDHGEEHDRLMAAVSHLPQVTATMLMAIVARAVGPDNLHWAGGGLRDTTRLASSQARCLAKRAGQQPPGAAAAAQTPRVGAGGLCRSARRSGRRHASCSTKPIARKLPASKAGSINLLG